VVQGFHLRHRQPDLEVRGVVKRPRSIISREGQPVGFVGQHRRQLCLARPRFVDGFRCHGRLVHHLIIEADSVTVIGFEFTAGAHPIRQGHQRPGGLLSRSPAPLHAVVHQPAHCIGSQRVFRIDRDQSAQHNRCGARVAVPVPAIALGLFPMHAAGRQHRLRRKIRTQRIQARVLRILHGNGARHQGPRVEVQAQAVFE